MQKCRIYHTGVYECAEGIIKNGLVYLCGEEGQLYFPEEMFLAREECENGLIQFEVERKWGFANIYTGEIVIEPAWEYAGPFYSGYAQVAVGAQIEINGGRYIEVNGGKHGFIDKAGEIVIPLEYDNAEHIPYKRCFNVAKNERWGLVDKQNKTIIPLMWSVFETSSFHDLIFCGMEEACDPYVGPQDMLLASVFEIQAEPTCNHRMKWGVYDQNFNLIVQPELDEKPVLYRSKAKNEWGYQNSEYYLLKRKRKYGILCKDGRLISDITLFKKDAVNLIDKF